MARFSQRRRDDEAVDDKPLINQPQGLTDRESEQPTAVELAGADALAVKTDGVLASFVAQLGLSAPDFEVDPVEPGVQESVDDIGQPVPADEPVRPFPYWA